jgi:transcription antitermination factor NusG
MEIKEHDKIIRPIDDRQWFVVYTRARAEKKVCADLLSLGIEAYLPLRKALHQWKDRKKMVEVPLISSYVFVKLKSTERDSVFKCNHIVRYITFEGKPVAVPEKQMISLKSLVESDVDIEAVAENIRPGENVKIIFGPLAGVTGEFISLQSEKRFLLRINKIGYSLVARIPAAWVEKEEKSGTGI